jgi:hypothetical protein
MIGAGHVRAFPLPTFVTPLERIQMAVVDRAY